MFSAVRVIVGGLLMSVLQPGGAVKATNPLASATAAEKGLLETAIDGLKGNIAKGVDYVQASSAKL